MANEFAWWAALKHGGLLMSPSRISEFFADEPKSLPPYLTDQFRRALIRLEAQTSEADREFLDLVFEQVCGLGPRWEKGNQVDTRWSHRALTGEIIKPRRVWYGAQEAVFAIFVSDDQRLGVGRGRRMVSRVIEWLRGTGQKLALLTNIRQFRLIHAGLDYDAFAEWDTDLWFEEGQPGPQITALQVLLSAHALEPSQPNDLPALLAAIQASRRGQAELSVELGERVRTAVELLIQTQGPTLRTLGASVAPRHIYLAATRIVMRMVIILFAEARDLLPRDNPIYHASYGLQGLRLTLERVGGGVGLERLRHRHGAWPRLLALFRLIYEGCHHQALPVKRYGGVLFAPGNPHAEDPVLQTLALFEDPGHEDIPSDADVSRLLELLCRTRVKVRQGRSTKWVPAPVDFSDLSSEYLGILYEGLLDYELRLAEDAIVFLALGDEPALPLSRLEEMDDSTLAQLVEKFKVKKRLATSEDETEEEDEEELEEPEELEEETEEKDLEPTTGDEESEVGTLENDFADADTKQQIRERAGTWAYRAAKVGKIVKRPRRQSTEAQRQYEEALVQAAKGLITKVVLPGEWFLVRWGGTRKGAGTFYTRPQLAVPTVQRTLRSLAYNPPLQTDGSSDEDAHPSLWKPKLPEQILALKVCDPAVGSGSFLVAALRFLTEALFASLHHHERIQTQGEHALVTLAEGTPSNGSLVEEHLPCRPDATDFELRLRPRLKRYVVERCLYGVDLDPLAIELARLTLWIETMDKELPFEFLDHKIQVGNSLVGCWFDRFRDYPVLAWEREGGDKNHSNGVHFEKGDWTRAIKQTRNTSIKNELVAWISGQKSWVDEVEARTPEAVHDEALQALENMQAIPVHEPEVRADFYREHILDNPGLTRLKEVFDTWCTIWFWPPDQLEHAPTPRTYENPPEETRTIITRLQKHFQFFHWELEFPDVFAVEDGGFDAIVGNPPWEIQKPNSKEYFSNLDPLYRTYGKQEALKRQKEFFQTDKSHEAAWLDYNAEFKANANFGKHVASPFGDGTDNGKTFSFGRGGNSLHDLWRTKRAGRTGYADPKHPYQYQGAGDINTYKRFLELSHSLLRSHGHLGMIVPSGVYTDKGSSELRNLFLMQCRWRWVFGLINWNKIFPSIYYRFKFCIVIVEKRSTTLSIQSAFSRYHLHEWEEAERWSFPYTLAQTEKFSPKTLALLEIRSRSDLEILKKIYENSILLGDEGPDGWGIRYATEFHMTNDSKLFPPRPTWEAKGYQPDEYGRWIGPDGDIALPLYEGRMIGQFDFSQKGWVSGKGRGALWRELSWDEKTLEPQYLMPRSVGIEHNILGAKAPIMNITSATNARTVISSYIRDFPCNHALNPVRVAGLDKLLSLVGLLNSIVFDFGVRARLGGLNLSFFVLNEVPIVGPAVRSLGWVAISSASLLLSHKVFAPEWLLLRSLGTNERILSIPVKRLWAITPLQRLRLRCILDSIIAELYGLGWDDLSWILNNTDHPVVRLNDKSFYRTLDPKGFWRVDKDKDPEIRQTVLTLAAFKDLKETIADYEGDRDKGIEAFCAQNDGDGWMLPETLRLDDLGLGHDFLAKEPQPVRTRFGERFLPWQLEQSVEESWAECERHARNILGEEGFAQFKATLEGKGLQEAELDQVKNIAEPNKEGRVGKQQRLFPKEPDLFGEIMED